jgi:hypothetical protein
MNCSYRILKDVHIGLRVRKTKDKNTVPFKNEPMTDVKIVSWNDQGFELSHPDLPKNIWVDFYQLPLDKIQLEYGVIKNPITFVEEIMQGGSMVLVRADTLDYMEMLHDKKEKEEAQTYSVKQLTPGDRVISAICKEGNVMVYLGTFNVATMSSKHQYGYGYNRNTTHLKYIDETPERAFFAYEMPNGKYRVDDYPLSNKVVKENYLASDKARGERIDPQFTNTETNMELIRNLMYTSRYSNCKLPAERREEVKESIANFEIAGYNRFAHIQKGKVDIRKNAIQYIKDHLDVEIYTNQKETYDNLFESYEAMQEQWNKNNRR